jgi:Transposase, Mutator family
VALLVDGIRVAEHCCVVALGITPYGTRVPLALAEGATQNATVVGDLLVGLRERGLEVTRPILVVLDGAKALRRAVTQVFDHSVIQRLKLHKLRNVCDRLPDAVASHRRQRPSAGRTGIWCCAGSRPAWVRQPSSSAGSTAICTYRHCAPHWTQPSPLSHRAKEDAA